MGGKKPQLQHTDFESMSHQQLVALIAPASPAGASTLSTKLAQASSAITKIGEDLKEYVTGLPWHGEGGDAFREWGGQTASATLRLGEYSKGASRWMELVAEAITEAKAAMPPVSETTRAQADLRKAESAYGVATDPANRNDPDARGAAQSAQSDAAAAQARMDAARFEAAQRLRKLAQTYEFSAQQVNEATPPTFPPPAKFMGEGWVKEDSYKSVPGEGAPAPARVVTGVESPTPSATPVRPDTAAGVPQPGLSTTPAQPPRAEPPTRMEIDGLSALPHSSPSPPAAPPVGPPLGGNPDPRGMPPAMIPPAFGKGEVKPSLPSAPPVTGRPGQGGVRPPALPNQGLPGSGGPGHLPRPSGIIGGRPVPPSTTAPARGIPRGLVVGGEGTPTARGPMGHQPAMGTGNGTSRPGAAAGRRYAAEAGGIVGGDPQAGRPGARQIAPGGSGPVPGSSSRPGTPGAAASRGGAATMPAGSNPSGGRHDRQASDRPDYLAEDEDTWKQNGRRIVPPVVE